MAVMPTPTCELNSFGSIQKTLQAVAMIGISGSTIDQK